MLSVLVPGYDFLARHCSGTLTARARALRGPDVFTALERAADARGISSPSRARVRSAGGETDVGHAEVDGRPAGSAHGFELRAAAAMVVSIAATSPIQPCCLGLLEPVGEIGMDLLQTRQLGRVNPKEWASDTGIFVLARRSVVSTAGSESDLPQLEVGEDLLPFGGGELTVFLAGPLGAAAGDEGPVMRDHVFGVDRGVPHRGVDRGVATDPGRDVRGSPERMASVTKILRKSWAATAVAGRRR